MCCEIAARTRRLSIEARGAFLSPFCGLVSAGMTRLGYKIAKTSRLLGASSAIALVLTIASANHGAFAGDTFAPETPSADQARCNAFGDGFYAVAGSNACVKISGYVAAGVDFAAPVGKGSSLFAPRASGGLDSETTVGAEMRVDTPLGPGRLYVQFGHDSYRP